MSVLRSISVSTAVKSGYLLFGVPFLFLTCLAIIHIYEDYIYMEYGHHSTCILLCNDKQHTSVRKTILKERRQP